MNILTKYILIRFVKFQLSSIIGVILIFTVIDFLQNSGDFVPYQAAWYDILLFYLYLSPYIIFLMAPYTVLFSTIACLSILLKNNEITAMFSSGKSLTSVTAPILYSSLLLTLFIFICNEFIMPFTYEKTFFIRDIKIRKQPLNIVNHYYVHQYRIWYNSTNNAIWNIDHFDARARILDGVNVYHFNEDRILTKWIYASSASYDGKDWLFRDGYLFEIDGLHKSSLHPFDRKKFQYNEKPDDFLRSVRNQKGMNIQSIYSFRNKLREQGVDTKRFDVDLHYKIAYPFICMIMALIGIPVSLKSGRSGGILFSVGLSFFIGWIYFFLFSAGISFGYRGLFPPWFSAWGINIIGITSGFYLLLSMDSDSPFSGFKRKRRKQFV